MECISISAGIINRRLRAYCRGFIDFKVVPRVEDVQDMAESILIEECCLKRHI
jgi:hypothetical protein